MHAPSLIAYLILGLSLIVHTAPTSTTVNDISGQLGDLDISSTGHTGNNPFPDYAAEIDRSKSVQYMGGDVFGPFVRRVRLFARGQHLDPRGPFTATEAGVPDEAVLLIKERSLDIHFPFSAPLQFLSLWSSPKPQFNVRYYGYNDSQLLVPASAGHSAYCVPRIEHRKSKAVTSTGNRISKQPRKSQARQPQGRIDQMDLS
ncbi:hypothetical protein EV361DRAFT_379602 [Lentinula raphanica]|uniref:Uncharacterized protein n=1 Tax=Lentinula raphanica TaxID=153919 RepID=A0AA38P735_9AGAR|nr:hypothetical protein F5878DRAFT_622235 [Lentinula raphanica]KAJ3968982.1 hypothetical protein EV361DRAFT_379602 [Lentinula raphanica]